MTLRNGEVRESYRSDSGCESGRLGTFRGTPIVFGPSISKKVAHLAIAEKFVSLRVALLPCVRRTVFQCASPATCVSRACGGPLGAALIPEPLRTWARIHDPGVRMVGRGRSSPI